MNILIDIGHPAHVHMFKHFAHEMIARGHNVLFTTRDKEFEIKLLESEGFDFVNLGKKNFSILGKIYDMLRFDIKLFRVARKFKPDVFVSHASHSSARVGWILRKPSIIFEDTFNKFITGAYKPFASVVLTSQYPNPMSSFKKNISYAGYNELLYLHPNRFTLDSTILDDLGLKPNEKYVVVRFVAWGAIHDAGHKGMLLDNKIAAIKEFSKYAKVFVSSEKPLPAELEQYRAQWKPERIHDVLSHASLVFGESATMVTEGAVLGVPGVYLDNTGRYYTREIAQKYNLCHNFTESEEDQRLAIACAVDIIKKAKTELQDYYSKQRYTLLEEHIDVTAFLVWFVENYPESEKIMRENPNYQYQFK